MADAPTSTDPLASGDPGPAADPRRWTALWLIAVAEFVVVLDGSIVNIALPHIGAELGVPTSALSWVVTAYLTAFGGLLLLGGRIADLLGKRRMFLLGLGVFVLASAVAAMATGTTMLVVARVVQGVGAAAMSPAALSLINSMFTGEERGRALGLWGAVSGLGAAAGVLLGGVLTALLGWRSIFLINIPIGLAVLIPALRLVPRFVPVRVRLDVAGAVLLTLGLGGVVFALTDLAERGVSTAVVVVLGVAAVLLVAFVLVERRVDAPLIPGRVLRIPGVTPANVVNLVFGLCLTSLFYFLGLHLQAVLGYGALAAGLALLPFALSGMVGAGAVAPRAVAAVGPKPVLVGGLLAFAVTLAWLGAAPPDGGFAAHILPPSLLGGLGLGATVVTVNILAAQDVGPDDAGLAGGLVTTTQQVGGALGLAVLGSVAAAVTGPATSVEALDAGFGAALWTGAGFALVAALGALAMVRTRSAAAA